MISKCRVAAIMEWSIERPFWDRGIVRIAGVDEAGRGPLAGPVVAAAVILPHDCCTAGIDDSKKLTPHRREELFETITRTALGVGIGIVDHRTIDAMNILNATFRAMHRAIAELHPKPDHILIDGPRFAGAEIPFTAVIDGDALSPSIAAASIIAKVTRDRLMREYDLRYPDYGFAKHKGYGTREHLDAIRRYGPCEIHRMSFRMPDTVTIEGRQYGQRDEGGGHCG